ncbi:MAG: hypothetical protein GY847_15290 [Proteobacteria bacterium]|nr:hypothetical protein [Pseudomonadota bacterium]
MKQMKCIAGAIILASLCFSLGCDGEETDDSDVDGNPDVDTDSDSDMDADSDVDTDSDVDMDSDIDMDSDVGTDSDMDSDKDSDTEKCTEVQWRRGCATGRAVGNWELSGYADTDGNHIVEQTDTVITLKDIHCTGKKSLVVVAGDTT